MRGTLLIFSGPSGVGKGTVVKELRRRSDRIVLSVSATTRAPRPEDVEGVTYFFKPGTNSWSTPSTAATATAPPQAPWMRCSTRDTTWCWRSRCRAPCR